MNKRVLYIYQKIRTSCIFTFKTGKCNFSKEPCEKNLHIWRETYERAYKRDIHNIYCWSTLFRVFNAGTASQKRPIEATYICEKRRIKEPIWKSWTFFVLTLTLICSFVCCSVLQCVAVCCSVLQCVAVCCGVLHCIAGRCCVLLCVVVCCCVLLCVAVSCSVTAVAVWCSVLHA